MCKLGHGECSSMSKNFPCKVMKEKIKISRCKTFSSVSDDDRDCEDVMNHNRRQLETTRISAIPRNVTAKLNDFFNWNDQIEYFMFKSRSSEHNDWIVMNSNYKEKGKDSLGPHRGSKSSFHVVRVEEEVLVNWMQCDLSDQHRHDSNWKSCRALPPIAIGVSSSSSSNSCEMTERCCSLVIWWLHEASSLSIDREYEFPHLVQGSTDCRQSYINCMFPFGWLRSQHTSDFAHKSNGIIRSSFRAHQLRSFFLQTMTAWILFLDFLTSVFQRVAQFLVRVVAQVLPILQDFLIVSSWPDVWKEYFPWTNIPGRLEFAEAHHSDLQIEANFPEVQLSSERCIRRWGSVSFSKQFLWWWRGLFCLGYEFGRSISQLADEKLASELSCIHVRGSVGSRHCWHNFDLFQGTCREIQSSILELIFLKM